MFIVTCAVMVLALTIAGCDLLSTSSPSKVETDSGIIFNLAEQSLYGGAPDEPRIIFSMRTEEIFPCANFSIHYDIDRSRNQVRIRVLEIIRPDICLTALGPARAGFELPLETGRYDLALVSGSLADVYSVAVTDDRIDVESRSATFSRPEADVYWRFPPHSLGFYCGTLIETQDLCTDFQAEIQDLDLTPIPVPDYGKWPYPLGSSGHYYDAPAAFYRYPDSATWDEVKERLRIFTRERLRGLIGVGLSVHNWRGDAVRSWMVAD